MSLPHFPSKWCRDCPEFKTRGKPQYWRCTAEGNFWECMKKIHEWKLEHEKLDAERDKKLRETSEKLVQYYCDTSYRKKKLKAFCEWLESGWDITYVKPEYVEKKKELGLNK